MFILNFFARLAICIIVIIIFEGIFTLGAAFQFHTYNIVAWVFQGCLLMIAIRLSVQQWFDGYK
jgi:hypothetical protein